ncbi:MAG: S8 family serine peptidase [Steroidobacteraceae bacterium]
MGKGIFVSRSKIAVMLLAASLVALPGITEGAGGKRRTIDASQSINLHGTRLSAEQARVQVFVRLDEPAVAELNAASLASTGKFATPAAQREQARRVSQQQARFRGTLDSLGAQVLSAQRVGANGMRVNVNRAELAALRAMPGVRSVGRVQRQYLDNIDSVPWIGAPSVWAAVGTGKGVSIGIIDTGIDYTHADFGGSGNPADYEANDKSVIEPGTFPTAKVKGGYDFAGPTYDANVPGSVPTPDPDPLDGNGHGTHVSGTAAGIGVPGSVGQGVAPGADLYALKVFSDDGGSTDLVSLAIEWAMDPNGDGDMSDHLDVINMSLGSPFGDPNDPSAISSNNAAAVGIIVATSAGNEGDTPYVTGSPGVASAAISTAANTPGGRLYSKFDVTAPASVAGTYPSLEGAGPVTFAQAGPISGSLVLADPVIGCGPLNNAAAIAGNVAFIRRGTCGFIDKYLNAQAAGATAIVVFNDGANSTRIDPIVMGGLDDRVTIPGLMISSTVGNALAATSGVAVTLSAAPDASKDDQIATFSSRGPGGGGSHFKPDLSAPGVAIVSAGVGTGTGSANFQGTSMASPHVAGAAALLRQEHPDLKPAAIKALLQNSTVDSNASGDTDLMRQGVGALRVDRAAALESYAAPAGVSFGRLNPLTPIFEKEDVTVRDLSGKHRHFSVQHVPNQTYPGVEVNCPRDVRVGGKGSAKMRISLRFDPRAAWDAGVYDNAIISQTEVDGWCVLSDGTDTLRVGYVAVVDPASGVFALPDRGLSGAKLLNIGPTIGWAEGFTLAKLGGERQHGTTSSIQALGFRRANPDFYAGYDVLELGIATDQPFEHLSNLEFTLEIDADGDGVTDATLVGADLSNFQDVDPGQFVTAQFDATGSGFLDWLANSWDYNDRTLILPFTFATAGGLVPEKFSYVLTVTGRDGESDVQHGTIDLAKEIVPDVNSFGVDPRDNVEVGLTGPTGVSMWLLQNNRAASQLGLTPHVDWKTHRRGR